jgi:hypothetical protein
MGWHVNTGAGPKGPFGDAQIVAAIRSGELPRGDIQICAEGAETWIALKDYPPFAAAFPVIAIASQRPKPASNSQRRRWLALGALGAVGFGVVFAIRSPNSAPVPVAAAADPIPPQAPAAPTEPTVAELLTNARSLSQAVQIVRPLMKDTDQGEVSVGAAALATWWAPRANLWGELAKMPDSKRAEILKDPTAYRGQKLCVTGTVPQISRDRSVASPVYIGSVVTGGMGVVRFVAVQSTAGVTEGATARFCGIVAGIEEYQNVSGGTTIAVQAVGLFDLPANGGQGLQAEEY